MTDGSIFIRNPKLQAYAACGEPFENNDETRGTFEDEKNPPLHFYITSRITEIHNYIDLIHALDQAESDDEIHIHLATPGGDVNTTIAIIHAINRSCARVIAHADAGVSSSGTFIFLACSEWRIHDYSYFMFHDGSVSGGDDSKKFNESKKMIDFVSALYEQMSHDFYSKIFSEREIREILNGTDRYLMGDEVKLRLSDYLENLES